MATIVLALLALAGCGRHRATEVNGWLAWRGPGQDGHSDETGLPQSWKPGGDAQVWETALRGRGSPVVSENRVFCIEAPGGGEEWLVCLDARKGRELWRADLSTLSGTVPQVPNPVRGGPAIDPETGNVCALGSSGLLAMFSPDGLPVWRRPMAEYHGWITAPHGAPAPACDGDLVIVHGLTAGWGEESESRDRFLAFDRRSGEHVWTSSPGLPAREASNSSPVFAWLANRRILVAGTGCGHLAAIDSRTGQVLWAKRLSNLPLHASPLLAPPGLLVVAAYDAPSGRPTENLVALPLSGAAMPEAWLAPASKIDADAPASHGVPWHYPSASPVLSGGIIWHRGLDGIARPFSPKDGQQTRQIKLGPAWPAAPPTAGDNKLFAPIGRSEFAIVDLAAGTPSVRTPLSGAPTGAPAISGGRVFVLTTQRLYCFGTSPKGTPPPEPWPRRGTIGEIGAPTQLQFVPGELHLSPGEVCRIQTRALDSNGNTYAGALRPSWHPLPPGEPAPLRISDDGEADVPATAPAWAGRFEARGGEIAGALRVRLIPKAASAEDFDGIPIPPSGGAPPPTSWIAARETWQIRNLAGLKILAASPREGERSIAFFGHPESTADTLAASIMAADGRRIDARAGLTLRRYSLILDGNWQRLEIAGTRKESNPAVDFAWKPGTWYRLRIQIETRPQGAAFVRARAWPVDAKEPHTWLIEAVDTTAHPDGAPGLLAAATAPAGAQIFFDDVVLGSPK